MKDAISNHIAARDSFFIFGFSRSPASRKVVQYGFCSSHDVHICLASVIPSRDRNKCIVAMMNLNLKVIQLKCKLPLMSLNG